LGFRRWSNLPEIARFKLVFKKNAWLGGERLLDTVEWVVMNVFTNLKAYTLPLVISGCEQVGWPARIECQPQPQRGQLEVALAVELAYAFASLLSQALSGWHTERGLPGVIHDNANDLDTPAPNKPQTSKSDAIYNVMLHLEFSAFADERPPIALLKSHGGDWWDAFVAYVAARIFKDLEDDIYSIALRDPNILWAIYQVDRAGKFIGTPAVLEVLHTENKLKQVWLGIDVSEEWPNQEKVRLWKHRLGEKDKDTQDWIRRTGGENHPYDFYATEPWQHPELFAVPRRDEFDTKRDSEKDKGRKIQAMETRDEHRRKFMAKRPPVRVERLRMKSKLRKELLEVLNLERAPVPADQDYSRFAASNVEP
jgi:hypothetical protein